MRDRSTCPVERRYKVVSHVFKPSPISEAHDPSKDCITILLIFRIENGLGFALGLFHTLCDLSQRKKIDRQPDHHYP